MSRSKPRICILLWVWLGAWGCTQNEGAEANSGALEPEIESGRLTNVDAGVAGRADAGGSSYGSELEARLPARIRRLTNTEYDATVQALLGTEQTPGAHFVPDAKLHQYAKFDRNQAQIVEPTLVRQLQQAAEELAVEYVANKLDQELPCVAQADSACAQSFFAEFLPRAYRREVTAEELSRLLSVVVMPAIDRDGFRPAIQLGVEAALQSAAFLYHTELGSGAAKYGVLSMSQPEIAQAISYLVTGRPADELLLQSMALVEPAERESQVRRLLQTPAAKLQVQRMIRQWLDIDQTGLLIKDEVKFPNFAPQRFDQETNDFIDEVVFARGGGFALLMGADFSVGSASLAEFYGAAEPSESPGVFELQAVPRRGITNLGAFLVNNESPIRRGARFLTQALCLDPGDPAALMLSLSLPVADASRTRRQRFEEHSQGGCGGCHEMIDSVGFSFEHFDAVGKWEAVQAGNAQLPIDSRVTLKLPDEIPFAGQAIADSAELAMLTSESEAGNRCFARNLARFVLAAEGDSLEQGFLAEWQKLAATGNDSVQELLVAYARSPLFVERQLEAQE